MSGSGVGGGRFTAPHHQRSMNLSTVKRPRSRKRRKRGKESESIKDDNKIPDSIAEKKGDWLYYQGIRQVRQYGEEFPKISDQIKHMIRSKDHANAYSYRIKDLRNGTIQVTTYDIPQMVGFKRKHTPERRENRMTANEQNAKRARRNVFELTEANLTPYTKFITLTYAEPQFDYDVLAKHWKSFIRHLDRKGYQFPYLWVIEKHDSEKTAENRRGSLHIHALAFTDKYIPHKTLAKAWPHGHVKINAKFQEVDHKASYVAKYIQKESMPPDKKAYRTSKDIKRPTTRVGLGGFSDAVRGASLKGYMRTAEFTYSIPTKDTLVKWKTGEVVPAFEGAGATVHTFKRNQEAKDLEKELLNSANKR